MTWNERMIARAIAMQTLERKCVVLVDNCSWTGHECDVLAVTRDLRVIDVEVKISRADFKVDARKDKWWHRFGTPYGQREAPPAVHRKWPPKVWKHYIAMPSDLWDDALFEFMPSPASGLLLVSKQRSSSTPVVVHCKRRATPNRDACRLKPENVIDIARLANLRMWAAYGLLQTEPVEQLSHATP